MGGKKGSSKKRQTSTAILPPGLLLSSVSEFTRDVQNSISRALNLTRVIHTYLPQGNDSYYYFREPAPVLVPGASKDLFALPVFVGNVETAWLVVEIKCDEQVARETRVTHASLKLYAGPTSEAAKLYFRAEWDARDNLGGHAQPHWNIHDTAWSSPLAGGRAVVPDSSSHTNPKGFIEFSESFEPSFTKAISQAEAPPPPNDNLNGDEFLTNMKKFHFSMSAIWHREGGQHAYAVDSHKDLARWISGCAAYIRAQMQYLG
jgi:hypothetical protein